MTSSIRKRISTTWQLASHSSRNIDPLDTTWISAEVPGAVQLDIAKAENYDPYWYGDNWQDYRWMEDVFWSYRTVFKLEELSQGEHLYFYSKGIDYQFQITINGQNIYEHEGMFSVVDIDLTTYLKSENELLITIFPAPKAHPFPEDRTQARKVTKPAVSYVWDWHPRLIPLGIWDETFLEIRQQPHILTTDLSYTLNDTLDEASVHLELIGKNLSGCQLHWELFNPKNNAVSKSTFFLDKDVCGHSITISNPMLWWPREHGAQHLYCWRVQILDKNGNLQDETSGKIGFRRTRLVMNKGAWKEPIRFPKSRSVPPITLEINGRRIFGKGTNWVNPEIFPGIITPERYEELLDLACEANFNLLRIWGGGIVNKESFFELCDEKGFMVWQEFPLSCNDYPDDAHYLKILRQEAEAIIKRLRPHPSMVMWCGGNELFNNWSGMTDQSLALRLLNSLCYELDPQTPFIMTAPVMGMGHGNYVFRDFDTGEEVFQSMPKAENTAYTEFGMPGPSSVEILKSFIPEDQLFPPKPGTVWETHHAFNAWQGKTWLMDDVLEDYFGEIKDLESLVEYGQWLQCEGYKCIYEEARRQWPYCSMALNWCYNEPWPTAANNSLINWPSKPKPAFYAVQQSCRPTLASARIPKFSWEEGESFTCDLYLLHDAPEMAEGDMLEVMLRGGTEEILLNWAFPALNPQENLRGPSVHFVLPKWEADQVELHLRVKGRPEWNSVYRLQYKKKVVVETGVTAVLNQ